MEIIDPFSSLNRLILVKEGEQVKQGTALKEHFRETYESLKPINILKETLKTAVSSPDLKSRAAHVTIGVGVGFLAKKLLGANSSNPIKKLIGTMIGSFIGAKAEDNADKIKSFGSFLLNRLTNHSQNNGSEL
jgi:hypothetical protein